MVAAVLFDFYGTLARATAWGPTIEDVLARRGLALDEAAHDRWQAEGADGVEHIEHSVDRDSYVAWERARLRQLVADCGAEPADLDEVASDLYRATKTFTLEAYEEVPLVLSELRARGVTAAVCSNWDWDLDRALARTGLDDLVDVVVTSAQAGARKPHPRIYEATLERCRVEPADALFVGDTWVPDVVGPTRAGLRPVHVWRPDERRDPASPSNGVPQVADLRGVLDLLAGT